jgi:anti-sigma B factor antagonist
MGTAELKITESTSGKVTILALSGDIDAHTSPILKEAAEKCTASGKLNIVFDFSGCSYISSAGIGVLNALLNALKAKGGKLAIACANKTITDTLEVMYFTKKVMLYADTASAVKNL